MPPKWTQKLTHCITNFLPDDIRWLPLCLILKCYGHTANLAKLKPRAVVVQHVQAVTLFARFIDILTLTFIIKMKIRFNNQFKSNS